MTNELKESLTDLRQHAINGWVAYGCQQMPRETAERMMCEYEEAILEEAQKRVMKLEEELQALKKEFAVDIIMKEKMAALATAIDNLVLEKNNES